MHRLLDSPSGIRKMKGATEGSKTCGSNRTPTSIESRNVIPVEVDSDVDNKKYEKEDDANDDCDDKDDNDVNDSDGQLASKRAIREDIISQFPQDNLVHCFGYGSGVFTQSLGKHKMGTNAGMLDLILVVDDTHKFHKDNLQRFPHHYASWLRRGGSNLATKMQRHGFPWLRDAHVLFHVVDADENKNLPKMKYGVVDREDLMRDLLDWDSLYLAGRMHKPTLSIVTKDDDYDLLRAQTKNLQAAMATALLLSSSSSAATTTTTAVSSMSWPSLYRQIAALSYTGDFRMQVGGEDPLKLDKLVQAPGQLQRFHVLYRPTLKSYETSGLISTSNSSSAGDGNGIEWDPNDPSTISHLLHQLPRSLRECDRVITKSNNNHSVINHDVLAKALSAIVAPAARNQSFKGIFTLGFRKTIRYASAKLSKGLFARK
mmetsp:Transcript_24240/g.51153  ORF Transcript_24240/g.51153 Transcript_24240/m.51153 type:complete len:430 (-) Transcript_24240:804-2093(-)